MNKIFTCFLSCLFGFLTIVTIPVAAQEASTYEVKKGDTLYSISRKLKVSISELKQWNNLSDNTISVGQVISYYRVEKQSEDLPDLPSSQSLIGDSAGDDNTYYTVKSGDNLYSISRAHNMTVDQLKGLNNLESDNIRVGQNLTVKKTSVAPSISRFAEASSPQGTFTLYEINRGEKLNDILQKFRMKEVELQQLNPQVKLNNLVSGQEITVLLPPSRNYPNPYMQKANMQDLGSVAVTKYQASDTGTATTNGELYDPQGLTGAHSNIALGSVIFVENSSNGNGLYIRITDRITGSGLKLSDAAFRALELGNSERPAVKIYTDS